MPASFSEESQTHRLLRLLTEAISYSPSDSSPNSSISAMKSAAVMATVMAMMTKMMVVRIKSVGLTKFTSFPKDSTCRSGAAFCVLVICLLPERLLGSDCVSCRYFDLYLRA